MKADNHRDLTGRYALVHLFFWAVRSALPAFAALYLQEKGIGASGTGVFLAVVSVMPALIMPYLAGKADRSTKWGLRAFFFAVSAVLAAMLLGLMPGRLFGFSLLGVYFAALVSSSVSEPFLNSMSGYYERHHFHMNFGVSRGIGSLSFAVSSYVLGRMIVWKSVDVIPWFAFAALALCCAAMLLLPPTVPSGVDSVGMDVPGGEAEPAEKEVSEGEAEPAGKEVSEGAENALKSEKSGMPSRAGQGKDSVSSGSSSLGMFLRRYPRYTILMTGFLFVAVFHQMTETYIFNMMEHLGGNSGSAGTALLIANVAEFAVIFNFERFRKLLPASRWLVLTAWMFALKGILFFVAPNIPFMYAAQALQAVTFGFYAPSMVHFAEEEVEPADAVRGQSVFMAAFTLGGSLGNLAGGLLLGHFSVPVMLAAAAGAAILGALISLVSLRRGLRPQVRAH